MRKLLLLYIVISTLLLSGCWDSNELNNVAVVTGIAIDPGENHKLKMTVGYVNPRQYSKQQPEEGAPVSSISLEGDTLPEISVKMNTSVSRVLIFSHTRVVYINEAIAKEGVGFFLEEIERSHEFRNDFNILITRGHAAEYFTQINDPVEMIPSVKVQKQIKNFVKVWGGDPRVRLSDFINAVVSKGRSPVASVAVIKGDPKKGGNVESNMNVNPEANIELDGLAVFRNDHLIGYLTLEDTRNYLWTQNLENTMMSIPCSPDHDDREKRAYFDLLVTKNKPITKVTYEDGEPHIDVTIYAEANLNSMQCMNDLTQIVTFELLEKKASKHIASMINGTIRTVQDEFGVDIFGFGEVLERQHNKKYKEVSGKWNQEFTQADVKVKVKVEIRRTGIRRNSFTNEIPR